MTAATLRQTAAPDANVKSEIHMALSLVILLRLLHLPFMSSLRTTQIPAFRSGNLKIFTVK